ncbi:glycerate kinase [Martelella alba]|uniref:Glycerate kinase n=1 Tax=Martelella alba TaxID=2590451 RepID=A0A506UIX0_9HYPH|nr:glycerate kinase [Martelella alba]TPW33252.1 glycerate kinase [Martelella alba]
MNDVFLKFTDETAALAALAVEDIVPDAESEKLPTMGALANSTAFVLHVCGQGTGTVYEPTGETITATDAETGEDLSYAEMAAVSGYHINMRFNGDVPASLAAFDIAPATPAERFA